MSSVVISTSAALSRPFIFDADPEPEVGSRSISIKEVTKSHLGAAAGSSPVERSSAASRQHLLESTLNNKKIPSASITPASQLGIRPAPEMASSGIPELDALAGGLPRGCLTEICGPASSGRTTVLLAALAAATRRGEFCAVIDASDALDPYSVATAGVDLDRLLWVRCNDHLPQRHRATEKKGSPQTKPTTSHSKEISSRECEHRLEQVLRATDLLLESGGFGLIILDLADMPPQSARRIPLVTWFRFRRAVEHKPTILLAIEQQAIAGSCSSLQLQLAPTSTEDAVLRRTAQPAHAQLLAGLEINVELVRSRMDRKPAQSIAFSTKTAWAG
jgi:hypothetical protein